MHMVFEHEVDFTEGSIFGFRKAEPAPNIAEQVRPSIEKASLCSPIPGCINLSNRSVGQS